MNERSPRASHIINWPTFSSRVMRPSRSATRLSTFRAGLRYAGVAAGDWAETLKAQSSRARLWKAGTSAAGGRTREIIFELRILSQRTTAKSAWSIADTVARRWWGGPPGPRAPGSPIPRSTTDRVLNGFGGGGPRYALRETLRLAVSPPVMPPHRSSLAFEGGIYGTVVGPIDQWKQFMPVETLYKPRVGDDVAAAGDHSKESD